MEEYLDQLDLEVIKNIKEESPNTYDQIPNYQQIRKDSYYSEKFPISSDDERQNDYFQSQKSSKALKEIYNSNNNNTELENNHVFRIEEYTSNNLNNKEINESLENIEKNNNSKNEENNSNFNSNEYNSGRWTNEEHQKFIEGIFKYGNEWKRVQSIIKTRSSTQARSHAQKFFLRMKKEISPTILSDENLLLQYIISSTNNSANSTSLTQEQKERLFSVIRSNLKPEENQNKNSNLNNIQYNNKKSKDLNLINEEEDDNLAYNKDLIINKKIIVSEAGEKRKLTFCSKKRKSSSDYILNDNKIFNIKKDINHKKSMDINKSTNNFINKLVLNNLENKYSFNEVNTTNNNNFFINNNINNNNFINNDKYINNCNNFNNYNSTNLIIQNNYYNIINNYNGIHNQNNLNSNINNPIYSLQNNPINNILNNDSINLDNNHNKINNIESIRFKDKNIKNFTPEIFDYEKNVINNKNLFENYSFLNNENFFPNKNNHFKTYENIDQNQNDPFNLKFENVSIPNDNNTINNDNIYLNHNLEDGHDIYDDDSERINFGKNNNMNDRPYDD